MSYALSMHTIVTQSASDFQNMVPRRRHEHQIGPGTNIVGHTTHHRSPGEPNWRPPRRSRWTTVHRAVETIAVFGKAREMLKFGRSSSF